MERVNNNLLKTFPSGNPFAIVLNIHMAPKYLIFAEGMSFED
jgi:hypothetical protein